MKNNCWLLAFITFSCPVVSYGDGEEGGHGILAAAQSILQKEKINEYRPLALSGDVEKALALSNHYSLFEDNEVDAEFWLRVAAERDNCFAIKEYLRRIKFTDRLNTESRVRDWKQRESKTCP